MGVHAPVDPGPAREARQQPPDEELSNRPPNRVQKTGARAPGPSCLRQSIHRASNAEVC